MRTLNPFSKKESRPISERSAAVGRKANVAPGRGSDQAPFPRAWGPPSAPIAPKRTWASGKPNGNVLTYAAQTISSCLTRGVRIPTWFALSMGANPKDFTLKFKNLPIYRKMYVSYVRLSYHLFRYRHMQRGCWMFDQASMPDRGVSDPISIPSWRLHEVLRTTCRRVNRTSPFGL